MDSEPLETTKYFWAQWALCYHIVRLFRGSGHKVYLSPNSDMTSPEMHQFSLSAQVHLKENLREINVPDSAVTKEGAGDKRHLSVTSPSGGVISEALGTQVTQ